MSDEEMFTLDDAENDGLIKREVGSQMAANLKRSSPQMFQMFEDVCESQELRPKEVLGDHALRAIRSEDHSEMLADIRVDMSEVNSDQIRIKDAEFIQELSQSLGLEQEDKEDPIDALIERRLKAKAGPMLPGSDSARNREIDEDVQDELNTIKERMGELQRHIEDAGVEGEEGSSGKDIDDLFGGDGDSDDQVEEGDDEVVESVEVDDSPDGGTDGGDSGEDISVDEFLEADDSSGDEVDGLFEDSSDGDDQDVDGSEDDSEGPPIQPDGIPMGDEDGTEVIGSEGGVEEDE